MSHPLVSRILATRAGFGPLMLRVPVGIILAAHGSQKLFGWFGGYGLEGMGKYMESIGLQPGVLMAGLAGSAEFFGGLALVLGLLTRPAAALVGFTMAVALVKVHLEHGLFLSKGGYEYALALLAVAVSLLVSGGGSASVDAKLSGSAD